MINANNYKNNVIGLWDTYKRLALKCKEDIKDITNNLDYTKEGKQKRIQELIQHLDLINKRQGQEVINYLTEGVEYLNRKLNQSTDPKKLLDTVNLIKEISNTLSYDEILKLTEEFKENPIAIKSINSVIEDRAKHIPYPPIYQTIKKIELVKVYVEQAIEVMQPTIQDTFMGWKFKAQIVEVEMKDIPNNLNTLV